MVENETKIIPMAVASLETDLEPGPYGIRQPIEDKAKELGIEGLDMVIVPGVAFDKNNNRLGRGGGYYDRFLGDLSARTLKVGLAFDFQMVDSLPTQEKQDVPVSCVLTN
jgi:5-formyltetrahydrofolate cyclo-ligase